MKIAFIVQRLMLLFGQFNYGKAGILDRTHTRLFTFRSISHLLRDAGFDAPLRFFSSLFWGAWVAVRRA